MKKIIDMLKAIISYILEQKKEDISLMHSDIQFEFFF